MRGVQHRVNQAKLARSHASKMARELECRMRRAGRQWTSDECEEFAIAAAKVDEAWADAYALSEAAGHPYFDRDGQRQNSEKDNCFMVTCVLQRYARLRGLMYDVPTPSCARLPGRLASACTGAVGDASRQQCRHWCRLVQLQMHWCSRH